jgi:hypothetical protein
MSGFSGRQRRRRQQLEASLQQGLFHSAGYRQNETTKETVTNLSVNRIREGSPQDVAASPRSSWTEEKSEGGGSLIAEARIVFPKRRVLYSMDVHGRRSEIDTSAMGELAYQKLLEAFQNPTRLDGPARALNEPPAPTEAVPEGYKIAPMIGLSVPGWWELPEEGSEVPRADLEAMLRRNLERAESRAQGRGRGVLGLGRWQR